MNGGRERTVPGRRHAMEFSSPQPIQRIWEFHWLKGGSKAPQPDRRGTDQYSTYVALTLSAILPSFLHVGVAGGGDMLPVKRQSTRSRASS